MGLGYRALGFKSSKMTFGANLKALSGLVSSGISALGLWGEGLDHWLQFSSPRTNHACHKRSGKDSQQKQLMGHVKMAVAKNSTN